MFAQANIGHLKVKQSCNQMCCCNYYFIKF